MKSIILICLVAVTFSMVCENPKHNNETNRLAPSSGILANSTTAPAELPVCKPLQGQEVCCEGPAWGELKENYDRIKDRFKNFVRRRKQRIEKIEGELNEDLVDTVSDLLNDNQAMIQSDAFRMDFDKISKEGYKTKKGEKVEWSIVQKKKFDNRGMQMCMGRSKGKCLEKLKKLREKQEEEYEKWLEKQRKEEEKWREELEKRRKEQEENGDNVDDNNSTNTTDDSNTTNDSNSTDGNRRFLEVLRNLDEGDDANKEEEKRLEEEKKRLEELAKEEEKRLEEERKQAEEELKEFKKAEKERLKALEKYEKNMSKERKEKWKEQRKAAKKAFKQQMKERKERQKSARKAKKAIAKAARKLARLNFVKHQKKCFKRLFKFTVGMMCMTCNANYKNFFFQNDNGTWQIIMNQATCNNLMRDCYPYLNATQYQGRQILDMARMKKF